jgi:hypothetical protein
MLHCGMALAQAQGCLRYHCKAGFQDDPLRQTDLAPVSADHGAVNCVISQSLFGKFT